MTMNLKKVFVSTSFNLSSVFYARFCAGSFYQEFDECRTFLLYKRKEVPAGTSFTTNHIHIFEGSPVNKIFKIGVQPPFQVQQPLDFQAFQTKVRILGKL